MAENLRTTKLNDNTSIPNVTDDAEWIGISSLAYCWYNNDIANKPTYGALYNWYAVNTGKLCPSGWHVPSDDEFMTLEQTLGMAADQLEVWGWRGTDQGTKMKEVPLDGMKAATEPIPAVSLRSLADIGSEQPENLIFLPP